MFIAGLHPWTGYAQVARYSAIATTRRQVENDRVTARRVIYMFVAGLHPCTGYAQTADHSGVRNVRFPTLADPPFRALKGGRLAGVGSASRSMRRTRLVAGASAAAGVLITAARRNCHASFVSCPFVSCVVSL